MNDIDNNDVIGVGGLGLAGRSDEHGVKG